MLKKVIYSDGGGMGMITTNTANHPKIQKQEIVLHGKTIAPGDTTTLDGYFEKSVIYAGIMDSNNQKVMCFYIGKDSNLFEEKHFFYCLIYLNENLIVNKYTPTSARPFAWTGTRWK